MSDIKGKRNELKMIIISIVSLQFTTCREDHIPFEASAFDFSASNEDGVIIYYNFLGSSGNKVMVVSGNLFYSGVVNIPDSVQYEGTVYLERLLIFWKKSILLE